MKRPAIAKEKHFSQLDYQYEAIRLGHQVEVSSAPSSKFLGDFLDEFPELTVEQGRRIVNYWRQIMYDRPRVKAAGEEVAADRI